VPVQPKTSENLPKKWQLKKKKAKFFGLPPRPGPAPPGPPAPALPPAAAGRAAPRPALLPPRSAAVLRAKLAFFAKFCKFLAGSFSAVSKRNFARQYAFDSISQVLQDLHPFAPLRSQNFRKKIGLKNHQHFS